MNQDTLQPQNSIRSSRSDNLNPRKLIMMIFGSWYYFLMALIVTGAAVYVYVSSTFPTYYISTTVLIEEEEGTPGVDLLEGFTMQPGGQNLDNQILIISSHTMVRNTLEDLPFEIDCYRKGLFNSISFFPMSPIRIELGPDGIPQNTEYIFRYDKENRYSLTASSKMGIELDTILQFGQKINFGKGSFTIYPQPELEEVYKTGKKIYIKFYDKEGLAEAYRERLVVETASRESSIIRISLESTNKAKDVIFLDKLTRVFIQDNLAKKNHEAKRVIEFIDAQLVDVSDSLMITENQLQEFRSRNRIMDISAQAQQIIDQAVVLENEKARLTLERNYFEYLNEYLSREDNDEAPIAPASMGIEDPLLANLMQELAGLQAEYFSNAVKERNPLQAQLELRIRNTKQSIKETLQGIMLASQMAIDENTIQINNLNAQASLLPAKERQLLGIERKFNLNNILYTFLLQRRAEAQIQKASNAPDNELIDPARANSLPVAPNKKAAFLIALSLGLGIPILILFLLDLVRNTVTSEDDLRLITQLPVVGHIPHGRLSYNTVVLTEPQSRISEAFRSIRTRMEFFNKEAKCPLILLSSSIPGEGKTFSAINLASAYSLTGKKTILIGFDMRRPTLAKSFDMNGQVGLSTYLIGRHSLDNVILETEYQNLHVIPSGPIPPNPSELSASEKAIKMFQTLKHKYDFIIVDTAPIGTVSDHYPIASIADAVLIMVRHGHTDKKYLRTTLSEIQASGISSLGLLLNDIKSKGSSYRYAYNYKYEYKHQKNKT